MDIIWSRLTIGDDGCLDAAGGSRRFAAMVAGWIKGWILRPREISY